MYMYIYARSTTQAPLRQPSLYGVGVGQAAPAGLGFGLGSPKTLNLKDRTPV